MARKKKRPFIDKNNSVTFKLVGRSQNDPLFVDETAPQYVLVEKKTGKEVAIDLNNDDHGSNDGKKPFDRRQEQIKYGIYFDDDYDYLQHLADVDDLAKMSAGIEIVPNETETPKPEKPSLMLPSSVFESTVHEREDLARRAALPVGPQPDWDPDIVEAMDDDFNFDDPNNQLDDDFVMQAMQPINPEDASDEFGPSGSGMNARFDESDDDDSVRGYIGSDDDDGDDEFEPDAKLMAKKNFRRFFGIKDAEDDGFTYKTSASTHFTEYSMSSSVVPRNDNLKTLDEQFEQMFIREYADEAGIGALDGEDLDGDIDPNHSKLMEKLAQEYQDFKSGVREEYEPNTNGAEYVRKYLERLRSKKNGQKEDDSESDSSGDDTEKEEIEIIDQGRKGDKDRFDCESVLSTYSSTMYHPKILEDSDRYGNCTSKKNHIRIDPRTGIPILKPDSRKFLPTATEDHRNTDAKSTRSNMTRMSELSVRPKNETPEERKQRKKELKELRQQRRIEKKANRLAFQEVQSRLHKAEMNKAVQKKVAVI